MNEYNNFEKPTDFNNLSGQYDTYQETYYQEPPKPKKTKIKKEPKPVTLTKGRLFVLLLMVVVLSFGGAFGGMTLYSQLNTPDYKNSGSVKGDGYELSKATGSKMTIDEVAEKNLPSVVEIKTESVEQDLWLQQYVTEGAGSGVIIKSDGYIITNSHVIEGASKITVTLSNKKEYTAKLIGADAQNDVAVIKINAKDLPAATYGDSTELEVGDMSVVIGNPLGELGGTVTAGIISCLDREVIIDSSPMTLLQTDASVNPGNSGGGMFDQYGHLIGIIVAKSSGSDVEGLGFAIPINTAAEIASDIMKNGKSQSNTTAYSGMTYVLQSDGVYIHEVNEDFAKKAGFEEGDKVIMIDGDSITDLETLEKAIISHKVGDTVNYIIIRDSRPLEISIKLQSK